MSYRWPKQDVNLRHFSPAEFDRPELMDGLWLIDLDDYRSACDFGLRVTDDARNDADMTRLYGADASTHPDSAHLYHPEGINLPEYLVRCADLKPSAVGSLEEREHKELIMVHHAIQFYIDGRWPCFMLELATRHIHIDDYQWKGRRARRPNIFPGVSR
jgi:hypothetical protein